MFSFALWICLKTLAFRLVADQISRRPSICATRSTKDTAAAIYGDCGLSFMTLPTSSRLEQILAGRRFTAGTAMLITGLPMKVWRGTDAKLVSRENQG